MVELKTGRAGRSAEAMAFAHWLRTGRRLAIVAEPAVEAKFNPWHDPRNGQFTFAPGGTRSVAGAIDSREGRSFRLVSMAGSPGMMAQSGRAGGGRSAFAAGAPAASVRCVTDSEDIKHSAGSQLLPFRFCPAFGSGCTVKPTRCREHLRNLETERAINA